MRGSNPHSRLGALQVTERIDVSEGSVYYNIEFKKHVSVPLVLMLFMFNAKTGSEPNLCKGTNNIEGDNRTAEVTRKNHEQGRKQPIPHSEKTKIL
jgi:hypothetical protein